MHTGNVLCCDAEEELISETINDKSISFSNNGIRIVIIDFTLSSMKTDSLDIAIDLADDKSLFEGEGDYQFDIYRMMRSLLDNKWLNNHNFKTNIFWLHSSLIARSKYHVSLTKQNSKF